MRKRSRLHPAAGGMGIFILTLIAYVPSFSNGFIWDDDDYVTDNTTLRDLHGLNRIWCERGAVPQYYPLTHTTFWIEYHLWGTSPLGYHLINTLLHAANAVLVWILLKRLKVPGAWAAGAIFAVHPMMVESVAWITERKNVLSGLFLLLSLHFYLRYYLMRERNHAGTWRVYILALGLFIAALLSKTIVATLPAVVLVLIWWKRRSIRLRDVWPLVPFFIVGIALALNTVWMEKTMVGAQGAAFDLSLADRLIVAGHTAWFYPGQLLWPAELMFIYPRWQIDSAMWAQWLLPISAVTLLMVLASMRHRIGRGPLAAALIYGGMLFPAMGFFNVYPMRFSFVANHFCYLPSIAVIALFVAFIDRQVPQAKLLWVAIIIVLTSLTWQQSRYYFDQESLWSHNVQKNPTAAIVRINYGMSLFKKQQYHEALEQYQQGHLLDPANRETMNNMGSTYKNLGQTDKALHWYEKTLDAFPTYTKARYNLALLLYEQNPNNPAVIIHLKKALADRRPNELAQANYLLGVVYAFVMDDVPQAVDQFDQALSINPDYAQVHYQMGLAKARLKEFDQARRHLRRAIQLQPDHAKAKHYIDLLQPRPKP